MTRIPIAVALLLLPLLAVATSLSLNQIVQLHAAGIGDSVIAHQVEADGISFQLDAAALLALRKAGLTDTVLDAVVKAGSGSANVAVATRSDPISELYKAGRYPEVADIELARVRSDSASDRDRTILILTLLKLDKLDEAKAQRELLATRYPASAYVAKVSALLDAVDEHKALVVRVNAAIAHLSGSELHAAIAQAMLSPLEKQEALAEAASMSGDFDGALRLLNAAPTSSYAEQDQLKTRVKSVEQAAHEYVSVKTVSEKYIHSSATAEFCDGTPPDFGPWTTGPTQLAAAAGGDFSVPSYVKAVTDLSAIAPLDPYVLDLEFHVTMISEQYSDVEKLGDRILAGVGQLRIPGYSNNGFFWLIINQENRKLYTEPDPSPFSTRWGDQWNGQLVPFDLGFTDIKEISQNAKGSEKGGGAGMFTRSPTLLVKHAYALKLKPAGTAPHYALMAFLMCSFGQFAQQNATYNFGRFIQHVVGLPDQSVQLVHPENGSSGAAASGALGVIGSALGVSNSDVLVRGAQQAQAAQHTALTQWSAFKATQHFAFSAATSPPAIELETSLGVSQDATH